MKTVPPKQDRIEDHPVAFAVLVAFFILCMVFEDVMSAILGLAFLGGLAFWVLARVLADIAAIFGGGDR